MASKGQDLIPRSILLLTKVAQQQQASFLDTEIKDAVVGRAQELINLLKLPKYVHVHVHVYAYTVYIAQNLLFEFCFKKPHRHYIFICIESLNVYPCLYTCSFANVVLNPDDEIETGRWHRDNTSLPITLRCVQHILS